MAIKIFGIITFLGGLFFSCLSGYYFIRDGFGLESDMILFFFFSFSATTYVVLVHSGYLKLMKKRNELELAKMEQEIFNIKTGSDIHQNT